MAGPAEARRNWRGYALQAAFALAGALVLAFVFVPLMSPGTDPVAAFVGSLMFMMLTIAAAHAMKRP
jgi:hypothetical protein